MKLILRGVDYGHVCRLPVANSILDQVRSLFQSLVSGNIFALEHHHWNLFVKESDMYRNDSPERRQSSRAKSLVCNTSKLTFKKMHMGAMKQVATRVSNV